MRRSVRATHVCKRFRLIVDNDPCPVHSAGNVSHQHPPGWPPGTPPSYYPPHQAQPQHPSHGHGYGPSQGYAPPQAVPHYPQYPQSSHTQPTKSGVSVGSILVGVAAGLALIIGITYLVLVMFVPGFSGSDDGRQAGSVGQRPNIGQRAAEAIRGPQVIVDEEIAVSAYGWQGRIFAVPSDRRVQVAVEGRTHTDKGFTVLVVPESDLEALKQEQSVSHLQSFYCLKVRSCNKINVVPAGSWAVIVRNSENIMNTMVVKLRVVSDPGG